MNGVYRVEIDISPIPFPISVISDRGTVYIQTDTREYYRYNKGGLYILPHGDESWEFLSNTKKLIHSESDMMLYIHISLCADNEDKILLTEFINDCYPSDFE